MKKEREENRKGERWSKGRTIGYLYLKKERNKRNRKRNKEISIK